MSKWTSAKTEQKFREADAAGWERATSAPPEAIDVRTDFGMTRAYRWPGSGPPVVFVHGMSDTSVRWIPYAEALDEYDVYAIDIMGDVGNSTPDIGFTSAADYGTWFGQAISALGLSSPHVVGASLGGYVVLSFATTSTDPASVVLFDPVGVVKLRLVRFMAWGFSVGLASFAPGPIRRWLAKRLRMPIINDKPAVKLLLQAQRGHPPKLPPLPVFTDAELNSISVPVRLLAGGKSVAFDVDKMTQRIDTQVSGGQASILPDAGHALTESHFDDCLEAVRSALTARRSGAGVPAQPVSTQVDTTRNEVNPG